MAAVTMHHFSGLGAPFVRSKGTVSGGVFNTASWYVNGSFLSSWYSSVDAQELPESAAAFVEMSREPAFSAGDGSGAAAMAPMG